MPGSRRTGELVRSPTVRWLAYVHPAFMLCVIALGIFVLREGLRIRRGRVTGAPVDSARHQRWAKVVVVAAALGFGAGLGSMAWLRERAVFESVHSLLAALALLGLLSGGALGLRLARGGAERVRLIHSLCAGAGLLFALAAGMAGMAILP